MRWLIQHRINWIGNTQVGMEDSLISIRHDPFFMFCQIRQEEKLSHWVHRELGISNFFNDIPNSSVNTSARLSSFFIEFEFQQVSNCRVRTCIKLECCFSISNYGSSNLSLQIFFELEFSRVWVLWIKTRWVFEFRVARSGTSNY